MPAEPLRPITNPRPAQQRALLEACADLVALHRVYRLTQDIWRSAPEGSTRRAEAFAVHSGVLREWSDAFARVRRAARAYTQYTRRSRGGPERGMVGPAQDE